MKVIGKYIYIPSQVYGKLSVFPIKLFKDFIFMLTQHTSCIAFHTLSVPLQQGPEEPNAALTWALYPLPFPGAALMPRCAMSPEPTQLSGTHKPEVWVS